MVERKMHRRILWIEDDYFHVKNLLRPLSREGWEIVPARSLEEGKSVLAANHGFDVVIVDLILPLTETRLAEEPTPRSSAPDESVARNGFAMLRHIFLDLQLRIPVIVMSVVTSSKILKELDSFNVARRLEKINLTPSRVRAVIMEVLGLEHDDE